MKTTGTSSTSFRIWLATFVPSVAAAVAGFLQNTNGEKSSVLGGAGIIAALVSTVSKLAHDQGLNKATLLAAGSDITAQLPQLKLDASKTVSFIESDLPALKGIISDLASRVTTAEAHVTSLVAPDITVIESAVRKVLGELAPAPVTAPVVEAPPVA
jgi:hypothetical protein